MVALRILSSEGFGPFFFSFRVKNMDINEEKKGMVMRWKKRNCALIRPKEKERCDVKTG